MYFRSMLPSLPFPLPFLQLLPQSLVEVRLIENRRCRTYDRSNSLQYIYSIPWTTATMRWWCNRYTNYPFIPIQFAYTQKFQLNNNLFHRCVVLASSFYKYSTRAKLNKRLCHIQYISELYNITVMYCSTPCLYSFRFVQTVTPSISTHM